MLEILQLLETDCTLTAAQIAVMLGRDEAGVAAVIADCEAQGFILGRQAKIDWEKTGRERSPPSST